MKSYIEAKATNKLRLDYITDDIAKKHPEIKYYYEQLGGERIKALSYKESKIKSELHDKFSTDKVQHELRLLLRNGERLPNVTLKQTIQYAYDKLGLKRTAKATDILKYLPNSKGGQKIIAPTGKRVNGWLIRFE